MGVMDSVKRVASWTELYQSRGVVLAATYCITKADFSMADFAKLVASLKLGEAALASTAESDKRINDLISYKL